MKIALDIEQNFSSPANVRGTKPESSGDSSSDSSSGDQSPRAPGKLKLTKPLGRNASSDDEDDELIDAAIAQAQAERDGLESSGSNGGESPRAPRKEKKPKSKKGLAKRAKEIRRLRVTARRNASDTGSESEGTSTHQTPSDMPKKTVQIGTDNEISGSPGAMETPTQDTGPQRMSPADRPPCWHGSQCKYGEACNFWHAPTNSVEINLGDLKVRVGAEDDDVGKAYDDALKELRSRVAVDVATNAESVMGNFAQRFTKENRHHLEVEAIVAAELLRKMGVPELREVCTRWCKSQDLPFVNEMTNIIIKELHRCRDADLSLRNMRKRTDITESPEKNEPPENESRRASEGPRTRQKLKFDESEGGLLLRIAYQIWGVCYLQGLALTAPASFTSCMVFERTRTSCETPTCTNLSKRGSEHYTAASRKSNSSMFSRCSSPG